MLGAPDTLISNTDGKDVFSAGGLKFQMIEAMRRWRIIFNGFAKRISNGAVFEGHKHFSEHNPEKFTRSRKKKCIYA